MHPGDIGFTPAGAVRKPNRYECDALTLHGPGAGCSVDIGGAPAGAVRKPNRYECDALALHEPDAGCPVGIRFVLTGAEYTG